jgi:hypothetical protein
LDLELVDRDQTEPARELTKAELSPGLTFLAGSFRWDGRVSMTKILESRTATPRLLPDRDSVDWNSRFNMRHGKYTSLSLEYSGRRSEGLQTIHNLRASLSATF